jgi:ubiquinone/menaquinone biosynthesis C-methylase UbiE
MSLNVYEAVEKLDWTVKYLTDKHVRMYETCNKYPKQQAKDHFDHVAENYEGMYLRMGYPDPEYVAKFVAKMAKKDKMMTENVKVIDFACGSGLVGKYLHEQGFKNIVGLDISPNMLEEASNKCVYSELHEHTLGNPEEMPVQFKNQFDFVTCAGLINNNHMDYLLFEEMLLAVKKGGYAVFATRFSYMGLYWYDQII